MRLETKLVVSYVELCEWGIDMVWLILQQGHSGCRTYLHEFISKIKWVENVDIKNMTREKRDWRGSAQELGNQLGCYCSQPGQRWWCLGLSHVLLMVWCKMIQPLWETVWKFLKKLHIPLLCKPTIILLCIYPNEFKNSAQKCL